MKPNDYTPISYALQSEANRIDDALRAFFEAAEGRPLANAQAMAAQALRVKPEEIRLAWERYFIRTVRGAFADVTRDLGDIEPEKAARVMKNLGLKALDFQRIWEAWIDGPYTTPEEENE